MLYGVSRLGYMCQTLFLDIILQFHTPAVELHTLDVAHLSICGSLDINWYKLAAWWYVILNIITL